MKQLQSSITHLFFLTSLFVILFFVGSVVAAAGDLWIIGPSVKMLPADSTVWKTQPSPPGGNFWGISVNGQNGDVWTADSFGGIHLLTAGGRSWETNATLYGGNLEGISVNSKTGDVWIIRRVTAGTVGSTEVHILPADTKILKSMGFFPYTGNWQAISVNSETGDVWMLNAEDVKMLPANSEVWQDKETLPAGAFYYSQWQGISVNTKTGDVWALNSDGNVQVLSSGDGSWQSKGPLSPAISWASITVNSQTGDVWVLNNSGSIRMLPAGSSEWQDKPELSKSFSGVSWYALAVDSGGLSETTTPDIITPTIPDTVISTTPDTVTSTTAVDNYVWIPNQADGTVSKIDKTLTSVVDTIIVPRFAFGVAVDDKSVWVTHNGFPGTVSKIDKVTGEVISIPVGGRPWGIAVDETHIWVVNMGSNSVSKIDKKTHALVVELTFHEGFDTPFGIAVDVDYVWVANHGSGTISKIDKKTNDVTNIKINDNPYGIAVDNTFVWVADYGSGQVSRMNKLTGDIVNITVGELPHGIAVDDTTVWVVNHGLSPGTVTKIDKSTLETTTIDVGQHPYGVSIDKDAVWVAFTKYNSLWTVSRIDKATDEVTEITVGQSPIMFGDGTGYAYDTFFGPSVSYQSGLEPTPDTTIAPSVDTTTTPPPTDTTTTTPTETTPTETTPTDTIPSDTVPADTTSIPDTTLISTDTTPTETVKPINRTGCLFGLRVCGNECLPLGTREIVESTASYCSFADGWVNQNSENSACQNNYECLSNQCSNGACIDLSKQVQETQGILEGISKLLEDIWNAIITFRII